MIPNKKINCSRCGKEMERCRVLGSARCYECKKIWKETYTFQKKKLIDELEIPRLAHEATEKILKL